MFLLPRPIDTKGQQLSSNFMYKYAYYVIKRSFF